MQFIKYHGSGNDFILIDNRQNQWENFIQSFSPQPVVEQQIPKNNKIYTPENIAVFQLCHRHFGIGADGLMLLQNTDSAHFEMVYFNSDGHLSTMCGNGGRCIAHYAASLGIGESISPTENRLQFIAPDGLHRANINTANYWVELSMNSVRGLLNSTLSSNHWVLNTGSPHLVELTDDYELKGTDFIPWAQSIRYSEEFAAQGINVNLVHPLSENTVAMRTYERGVENETLSCGTGVTAAAIAFFHTKQLNEATESNVDANRNYKTSDQHEISVQTSGGELRVRFQYTAPSEFDEIILAGPALPLFVGHL